VSLGRLIGSNRQYIEDVIPHIGSPLHSSLEQVIGESEVVVIATAGLDGKGLEQVLRPDHVVIDLVNFEKSRRPQVGTYRGICW